MKVLLLLAIASIATIYVAGAFGAAVWFAQNSCPVAECWIKE